MLKLETWKLALLGMQVEKNGQKMLNGIQWIKTGNQELPSSNPGFATDSGLNPSFT